MGCLLCDTRRPHKCDEWSMGAGKSYTTPAVKELVSLHMRHCRSETVDATGEIRATLMVNFGPNGRCRDYATLDETLSVNMQLVSILQQLILRIDKYRMNSDVTAAAV